MRAKRVFPQSVIWITETAVVVSYRGGMPFDAETLGLMRQVLDDICRDVPVGENHVRTFVATALLDCANTGERSLDALKEAAGAALLEIYSDSRAAIASGRVIRS